MRLNCQYLRFLGKARDFDDIVCHAKIQFKTYYLEWKMANLFFLFFFLDKNASVGSRSINSLFCDKDYEFYFWWFIKYFFVNE